MRGGILDGNCGLKLLLKSLIHARCRTAGDVSVALSSPSFPQQSSVGGAC